jgi:hypothetical protein
MMEHIEAVERINKTEPALIFIPDISGFTEFLNNVNLQESKHLIHALLEVIIDPNCIGLRVGEIEGDAIIFYQLGIPPNISAIECQTKKTFGEFQRVISDFENRYPELSGLSSLTLKFICHYGELTTTQVKDVTKLIGSDLILSHRLLKNNIESNEYLLLSDKYLQTQEHKSINESFPWSTLRSGRKKYRVLGTINYKYVPLTPLRALATSVSDCF